MVNPKGNKTLHKVNLPHPKQVSSHTNFMFLLHNSPNDTIISAYADKAILAYFKYFSSRALLTQALIIMTSQDFTPKSIKKVSCTPQIKYRGYLNGI